MRNINLHRLNQRLSQVRSSNQKKKGRSTHNTAAWCSLLSCLTQNNISCPHEPVWPARDMRAELLCCSGKDLQTDIELNYGYFSSHSPAVIQHIYPSPLKAAGWMDGTDKNTTTRCVAVKARARIWAEIVSFQVTFRQQLPLHCEQFLTFNIYIFCL